MSSKKDRTKSFEKYLLKTGGEYYASLDDYLKKPAVSFLNYLCEAHYVAEYCKKNFPKKADNQLNKEANNKYQLITSALFTTIMGNFELFQKSLFAQLFEYSRYLKTFTIDDFKKYVDCSEVKISILSNYRGLDAPVGITLAYSLSGWHYPEKVNNYYKAFGVLTDFYSSIQIKQLYILWQIRHSMVHTGGTITRNDASKVPELVNFPDKSIVFQNNFISALSSRFHRLIKESMTRYSTKYLSQVADSIPSRSKGLLTDIFKVESKMGSVWL